MKKELGKLIGEWILFLLAPPITLILIIEFAEIIFNLSILYGFLFLIAGIIIFTAEVYFLFYRTKEILNL